MRTLTDVNFNGKLLISNEQKHKKTMNIENVQVPVH